MVPDLIMNLELETGEPITTEMLRYGQQLATVALPAHALMKTPEALKVVGPKAFGYADLDFVPLASSECRWHREGGAMTDLKLIRTIDVADLDDIATGGAILGTGGGGDPYIGKLMAQEAIRRHGAVSLVDVDGFAADALIAPVCMMGAPTVMTEKLPQGEEIVIALRKLEKFMGRQVDGLLCGEAGGINSTTPFVAAAATGLPLIDGDGMGRAFPELQMTTFGMHGVSATPMVLGDDKGNSVVLETINNRWTERLARSATVDMGGSALLAFYPMTGALAKKAIVRGTLTLCAGLGRTLREARVRHDDPIEAVRAVARGRDHLQRTRQGRAAPHGRRFRPRRGRDRGAGRASRSQAAHRLPERIPDRRAQRQDGSDDARHDHAARRRDRRAGHRGRNALRHPRRRARLPLRRSNGAHRRASNSSARAISATTSTSSPSLRAPRGSGPLSPPSRRLFARV